ncbi:tail fiber protein [Labrenzia sp. OB1]|uniref:phage tail protein n=1 Tax=Labrenzia sp. OB1 TaxID=1561204 RepID=UPI0007B17BAC|nr:tail fiber protein [Labrenzia sp. OB1]KZM49024.1 tail collar protein [Labrenzia sp. OB1]
MSDPFIAEIRIFAGNFAPRGWAFCDGQLLPISQNTALFSLIGTIYGGDGRSTTALPNLQGRAPMHPGHGPGLTSRLLGERVGGETVTLSESQIPSHTHTVRASSTSGGIDTPSTNTSFGRSGSDRVYHSDTSSNVVDMSYEAMAVTGGGQAHTNLQPYLAMNFIIALLGTYPSRS